MRALFAPHMGRHIAVGGRKTPAADAHLKCLNARNYVALDVDVPNECDYGTDPEVAGMLADVYCNDALGCCVISGFYHVKGTASGNSTPNTGDTFIATPSQIVHDYSRIGGYVPGNASTDRGCDMQAALCYYDTIGDVTGARLHAWCAVEASNRSQVKAAVFLFENVYIGMGLPDAWLDPVPQDNGFVWDVAGEANPHNGHCFVAYGYNSRGLLIDSWGLKGLLTWEALAKYADPKEGGELYALLLKDMVAEGSNAPNGLAWETLRRDFDQLTKVRAKVGDATLSLESLVQSIRSFFAANPEAITLKQAHEALESAWIGVAATQGIMP